MPDQRSPFPVPHAAHVPALHRFPCEACGSDMRFDPGAGRLICDHCGHVDEIDEGGPWAAAGAIREQDFRAALDAAIPEAELEETRVMTCASCGAEVEYDEATHAARCPFCDSPVVGETGTHRHIKPQGLLPFRLDEAAAKEAMTDWLGSLWFAPNGLTRYARKGRRLDGIYLPFWTFDARTESRYRGERGTEYHETKSFTRNGKRETRVVTRVRWHPAAGRVARAFDDVLVAGTRSLPERLRTALGTWDLPALEPYRPDYLAGFRAEAYGVELSDAFTDAREIMDRQILRDVKFDIGGDRQRVHEIRTDVDAVTFKHVLLPVWLAAYKFRGRTYRFAVNARTGAVAGERPWSTWKIALAVIAAALVAGVVGYFYAQGQ